uniref:Immunoglobulin V-set domain-containing protein n=1 Tax=Sparus aurata TaxID=8175 RepID=A0A671VDW9_SPAAU
RPNNHILFVIAVTPVFVQKGDDVMLNLTEADVLEDSAVFWNFNDKSSNKESVIVRWLPGTVPHVSLGYRGRIEFTVKKYCVKLKTLQETDSGVYTATVFGEVKQTTQYNVTVQVSPVRLTVDSVSSSSDSCNLTVTCSTQDSHISSTFTCDNKTCSQEGGERSEVTTSAASLRVYLVNDSVTCNHSNRVSWTNDMEKAKKLCIQYAGKNEKTKKKTRNLAVKSHDLFPLQYVKDRLARCGLLPPGGRRVPASSGGV